MNNFKNYNLNIPLIILDFILFKLKVVTFTIKKVSTRIKIEKNNGYKQRCLI